jgi:hypothetical protein
MTRLKDYPLFIPPQQVANSDHKIWTLKEAKLYFEWLMSVKDARVEYLLTVIDESLTENREQDLKRIGEKIYNLLFTEPFAKLEDNTLKLTNKGHALAADMALLLCQCLLQEHDQLKWGIVRRPKRDLSYHLPALMGFPNKDYVELMRVSIVNSKAILSKEENYDVWWEVYKYCDDLFVTKN